MTDSKYDLLKMKGLPPFGAQEMDFKSDYSLIRLRRQEDILFMFFVRDTGEEVIETVLDLNNPHILLAPYTQYMFLSYLFFPNPKNVLFMGLGGGAMIRFLQHYDPSVHIDVVEVDPIVVRLANDYFGVRNEDKVNVMLHDGFQYLKNTESKYDVIYLDAFLKPSKETDSNGTPLQFYTQNFYKMIREKLKSNGLVAFNLNPDTNTEEIIEVIHESFLQSYVYKTGDTIHTGNLVIIALSSKNKEPLSALTTRAIDLENRFEMNFRDMMKSEICKK